jgi:hypothetical protein
MSMGALLILASLAEAATGLVLLVSPSIVSKLLFGEEIIGVGVIMSRIAAISLIALSVACWPAANMRRAFIGMLTYSVLVMLYLLVLGIGGTVGVLLWPAVAAHAGLSVLLTWGRLKQPKGPP